MEVIERKKKLIVGLGNPGQEYDRTRHNIGFEIVADFAKKAGATLVKEKTFPAFFAKMPIENDDVMFLLPLTYMNSSGAAIKRCIDFFKIPLKGMLVITDDIELPFKTLRLRPRGRCGGHNGLLSVEQRLGTIEYNRLKIGVGYPNNQQVKDYVLGKFSKDEEKELSEIINSAHDFIRLWLKNPDISLTKDLQNKEVNKINP